MIDQAHSFLVLFKDLLITITFAVLLIGMRRAEARIADLKSRVAHLEDGMDDLQDALDEKIDASDCAYGELRLNGLQNRMSYLEGKNADR